MECTLKESLACRDHVKVSHPSCKLTFNNLFTKRSHPCSLSPTKALLKEIFSGEVLNTSATVACRLQTMLNNDGNWNLNIWSPNHMSIPESSFLPSVRNTRQSPYCTRQRLCRVRHSANSTRDSCDGEEGFAECLFSGTRQSLCHVPKCSRQNKLRGPVKLLVTRALPSARRKGTRQSPLLCRVLSS